ncbi:hypothetical protein H4582DRAFT_920489 [Lactarius indigo]|nr:hypothetical protein H4582DRAFT_920489 [Lactarius indigo]
MKPIRDHCCCPTFLIALAGPWMCILGAVFVVHVVVQQLTNFVWIGGNPYNDDKLKSVTRILVSLGTGIAELEEFYDNLKYSVGEHVVRFSYQAHLMPKTPESSSKAIFLATTETGDRRKSRREIVIKFVQRYNNKAHRLLATADLAPELLYCSTEDPNPPDLAGLIMVVMEYVNGTTAHQRYGNERLPQPISDRIEEALGILHANNIVFGDLRHSNIMITRGERVLLIDFDWCGVHEEQTYPVSLNDARNTTNSIGWHPGVNRGGRMMN